MSVSPITVPAAAKPAKPLEELVHPSWVPALRPVESVIAGMGQFLRAEVAAGRGYLPAGEKVLRAFSVPLASVKVLIVGQDPYPTPGHPIGLSFAVDRHVRPLPRSLANIYRELVEDTGVALPEHGDLSSWQQAGVMLLNRALSVQAGKPASHRGKGWEQVTDAAVSALVARDLPLVAILWGRDAAGVRPLLGVTPCVTSPHPSPMSADRGFFGSRPFTRANALLARQGADLVDWTVR